MTQTMYKLPSSPKGMGGLQWQALFTGIVVLFGVNVVATQRMASLFNYQDGLGQPVVQIAQQRVYAPYMWAVWFMKFERIKDPEINRILWQGLTIAAGGSGVSVLTAAFIMYWRTKKLQKGNEHLHGSARWAVLDDIKQAGLLGGSGVYVGGWVDPQNNQHYLRHNGPEHVVAFAPTRSGKGVSLVLPTLLSWPHSVVVYDIKGENYALTSGWRSREANNRVLKFSPVEMGVGVQYNPLQEIRLGTPRDVSDAQNIAHMLTHHGGSDDDDSHWIEGATSLLVGVILYTCYMARKKGRVACLPDVAQVLTRPGMSFADTLNEMLLNEVDNGSLGWVTPTGKYTKVHPVVAEKAQEMLDKEERELSGILSTAKTKMQLYSDPIVSSNIRRSDFSISDLMNDERPVSLYIVVPPSDKDRLKPLTRLLLAQIVNRLTEAMEFKDGQSVQNYKHRLLALVDEFPTLGRLDTIVNAMAYTAGYGIKFYLIIQDRTQLHNVYGDNELVFSNTHVRVAFAPNNFDTAEFLSRMTGTMTVVKAAFSYSGNRLSPMLGQVAANVEEVERPLLTADECSRLPGAKKDAAGKITEPGDMLVFVAGFPPVYGKQILYFKDSVFARRAKIQAPVSLAVAPASPAARNMNAGIAATVKNGTNLAQEPEAEPDLEQVAESGESLSDEFDELEDDDIGSYLSSIDDDANEKASPAVAPVKPAVPYVKRASVSESEDDWLAQMPDMSPVEPINVKPPKGKKHVQKPSNP